MAVAMGGGPITDQDGRVFGSLREAAAANGLHRVTVSQIIHGKRRSSRGLTFRRMAVTQGAKE
jgi:hypothetical protein